MEAVRVRSRMRIRTIMAAVAVVAVSLWGYVEIWPRVRYWWPQRHLFAALSRTARTPPAKGATLEDIIKYIKVETSGPRLPTGVPIYIDPVGLQEAGVTLSSTPAVGLDPGSMGTALEKLLRSVGLSYFVKDGLVTITSIEARPSDADLRR